MHLLKDYFRLKIIIIKIVFNKKLKRIFAHTLAQSHIDL